MKPSARTTHKLFRMDHWGVAVSQENDGKAAALGGDTVAGQQATLIMLGAADLRTEDVLLCRGRAAHHRGNAFFNALVDQHHQRYLHANGPMEKQCIVNLIANTVEEYGGRFLKLFPIEKKWQVLERSGVLTRIAQVMSQRKRQRNRVSECSKWRKGSSAKRTTSVRRPSPPMMPRESTSCVAARAVVANTATAVTASSPSLCNVRDTKRGGIPQFIYVPINKLSTKGPGSGQEWSNDQSYYELVIQRALIHRMTCRGPSSMSCCPPWTNVSSPADRDFDTAATPDARLVTPYTEARVIPGISSEDSECGSVGSIGDASVAIASIGTLDPDAIRDFFESTWEGDPQQT